MTSWHVGAWTVLGLTWALAAFLVARSAWGYFRQHEMAWLFPFVRRPALMRAIVLAAVAIMMVALLIVALLAMWGPR